MKTKLIYLLLASALVGGSSTVFAQKSQSTPPYVSQVWNPDLGNGMYKILSSMRIILIRMWFALVMIII